MQYMTKRYKNFTRISASILLVVLFASVLFLIFNIINSNKSTRDSIALLEQNTADKATVDFSSIIDNSVMINSTLYTFITSNYSDLKHTISDNYYMINANIKNQIQLCTSSYNYIYGVKVETPFLNISSGTTASSKEQILIGKHGSCSVYYTIESKLPYFIIKNENDPDIGVTLYLDAYQLGKEVFYEHTPGQLKLVTDEKGYILSSNRMEYLNKNIKDYYDIQFKEGKENSKFLSKEKQFFSCSKTNDYNLYVMILSSNEIYKNFSPVFSAETVVFFLVSLVILTAIGILVSLFVYRPIRNLINITSKYFPVPLIKNLDELEYLQQSIIKQSNEKEELSADMEKTVSALRQQEILALQSQISPHYISNMLDAINWIAIKKLGGPNEISYCTEKTAYLFRYGMNLSSSFDTLKNEIDIAKNTLDILNIRYRTNIELICNIPDELFDLKVIKVLLQPFIENAVVHGFANYKTDGFITISARNKNGIITIDISDNGKGLSTEEIEVLTRQISDFSNMRQSNIGLWNVNYRTQLIFGEKYSVKIKQNKDGGSRFTISFPIVEL